tara:strand:- start:564 stop:1394 length:831 start_codon:yes stop_codon:yes gene_type:complete
MNSDFFIYNNFSRFIEINGEDRDEFLQSLITNDIFKCIKDSPIYSCLLSPQGKFLADFFVINQSNNYLIEIHEKFYESFYSKLQVYKLRSKVNFTKKENIISIILFSNKKYSIKNTIVSFKDPRNPNIGKKILISDKEINIKNINEKSFDKYKEILMKNLVPFTPIDLQENKSLLMENNLQNLQAIDWEKGCYVGQEITARMKYRALLKKKIYLLEVISGKIEIGDEITINKMLIGKVVSKINKYILCMLKIELVENKNKNKEKIEINNSIILKFL